jgi:hypothetical protein
MLNGVQRNTEGPFGIVKSEFGAENSRLVTRRFFAVAWPSLRCGFAPAQNDGGLVGL